MTIEQKRTLNNISEQLNATRQKLDNIMYNSINPLSDEEYSRIREGYDKICEAIDKLN